MQHQKKSNVVPFVVTGISSEYGLYPRGFTAKTLKWYSVLADKPEKGKMYIMSN